MPKDHEYLMLIDGHALIYRAYHAFPPLTTSTGLMVNAVYGFSKILLAAIHHFQPKYLAVAFDHPKPTFRHEKSAAYKATRVKMPDDLIPQIEVVKRVVTSLNIPQFEVAGFEADDLIGSIAHQVEALVKDQPYSHLQLLIVTGDRDTFQLVSDCVHVWMPGRGKGQTDTEYDRAGVKTKMGVFPEQIVDLKALMGDSSDNIPGVKGIGEKTAVRLIQEFGTVEKLYEVLGDARQLGTLPAETALKGAVVTKLQADKDAAFLSQDLATISRQAPITLNLEACQVSGYNKNEVADLFQELGFKSLVPLLPVDEFELGVQNALF